MNTQANDKKGTNSETSAQLLKFRNMDGLKTKLEKFGQTPDEVKRAMTNKLHFAIFNIAFGKDFITFETLSSFFTHEKITLPKAQVPVWDVYSSCFYSMKNCINTLLFCIEEKVALTPALIDKQKSLAPKSGVRRGMSFSQFMASLTPQELEGLVTMCTVYRDTYFAGLSTFDEFIINDGQTFKEGDLITLFDRTMGETQVAIVIQASEGGFITAIGDNEFTLTKCTNPRVISKESIDAELYAYLCETYGLITESLELDKVEAVLKLEKNLARLEKENERLEASNSRKIEVIGAKAKKLGIESKELNAIVLKAKNGEATVEDLTAKFESIVAQANKQAEAKRLETFEKLKATPIATMDDIKVIKDEINKAGLLKEEVATLREKIVSAQATIQANEKLAKDKAKAEAQKLKDEAKAKSEQEKAEKKSMVLATNKAIAQPKKEEPKAEISTPAPKIETPKAETPAKAENLSQTDKFNQKFAKTPTTKKK